MQIKMQKEAKALKKSFKNQSAMEYLMTYGWAILIIAVVLSVLFYLGVFNPLTFAPRQQAGSCQVMRPNGPGTNFSVNLVGECSGIPDYVVNNPGPSPGCANAESYIYLPLTTTIPTMKEATITYWGENLGNRIHIQSQNNAVEYQGLWGGSQRWSYAGCGTSSYFPGPYVGKWAFYAFVINNNTDTSTAYFNNNYSTSLTGCAGAALIGVSSINVGDYFPTCADNSPGNYSNVQFYNTALSANDIQTLYQEGIGGAPFDLQNLVGWWPLNGNANDYSGNGNNGVPTNVIYTNTWINSYTPP